MLTFSIAFKATQFSKPIKENVQARHIKEAVEKIKKKYQNVFILSYMQN